MRSPRRPTRAGCRRKASPTACRACSGRRRSPRWEAVEHTELGRQAGVDFAIDVSPWRERRIAALRAHRSQHLSVEKHCFSRPDLDRVVSLELWRQGYGPALRHRPATDILDGVPGG